MKISYTILHEDADLILVNKPSGLLTIPDRFDATKPNLQAQLAEQFGTIYVVHRLDRETSGVICFARNEAAHRNLSIQFEQREVEKIYYALVEGRLAAGGEIDESIAPHPFIKGKMIAHKRGKASLTLYKSIERFKNYTLAEVSIKTGRTHQIRVHFSAIGHPLAIDSVYGRKETFLLSEVKRKRYNIGKGQEERPLMSRTTLHAYHLQVTHPSTGEKLEVEAPLHKDFSAVLKQLRKWAKEKK